MGAPVGAPDHDDMMRNEMSAAAKAHSLTEHEPALIPTNRRGSANGRVVRDFAMLLGIALGIGLATGLGMMLAVLLIA